MSPVNVVGINNSVQKDSKKQIRWRRVYKACTNCHTKKVKCDLGPLENPHPPPCNKCKREGKECVFGETKRRNRRKPTISDISKIPNISLETKDIQLLNHQRTGDRDNLEDVTLLVKAKDILPKSNENPNWKVNFANMRNALEFLAKAAGQAADEGSSHSETSTPTTKSNTVTPISNPSTLGNLTVKASTFDAYPLEHNPKFPETDLLIEQVIQRRSKPKTRLTDYDYIGPSKMISENEAIQLINAYFLTMDPFFPFVPLQLHDPDELARYPILLCTILTIASRYHKFSELGEYNGVNNKRHIDIHEKLWVYCQKMISQTVWAEASTRSVGTVLAFLLFSEWNPRAIHWKWADYANNPKMTDFSTSDTGVNDYLKVGQRATGFGAIRRSDRMAWMLTGTSLRIAQDMGFMQSNCNVFVGTHISETFHAMNVNQRSSLNESLNDMFYYKENIGVATVNENKYSLKNEKFYLENIFEDEEERNHWLKIIEKYERSNNKIPFFTEQQRTFLNDEFTLYYSNRDTTSYLNDEAYSSAMTLPSPLHYSKSNKAKIELIRILATAYKTIYSGNANQKLSSMNQSHNLALLDIFTPLLRNWALAFGRLLEPCNNIEPLNLSERGTKSSIFKYRNLIEGESFICDYYYCQLYIFSLALQVGLDSVALSVNEMTKSSKYITLAYESAKEYILSTERVHKIRMLKYMPVRWLTRLVRSTAFLVKCYLAVTGNDANPATEINTIFKLGGTSPNKILDVIHQAAILLGETAPDELHLCSRYSSILLCFCNEMEEVNKKKKENMPYDILDQLAKFQENLHMNSKTSKIGTESLDDQSTARTENTSRLLHRQQQDISDSHLSERNMNKNTMVETDSEISNSMNNILSRPHVDTMNINPISIVPSVQDKEDISTSAEVMESPGPMGGVSYADEFLDWFSTSADLGLEFVESWTEMLEQRYLKDPTDNRDYNNNNMNLT